MTEQKFLKELDAKLWKAANKLLPSLDAAVYKHVVLGLVFVKYVSDSFKIRRAELKKAFSDASNEYFLGDDTDEEIIAEELENRDYYTEKNIFWIPQAARWEYIQDYIRLGVGAPMPLGGEFKGAGKLIDDAMELIEKDNPKLKRILNKNYAQLQIEQTKLADLLDLIASIPFSHDSLQSKDILGHVYEYFLGMFAAAEGKKGGQFYTPKSIVNLIVEMVEPYEGRVYDPAMGSGGFFISSEKFIEEHQGKIGNISVYGQESNPTTWRLAAMNMAIRGIDFNFGKEPTGSFINDQHPDLRADFVLANPPFNQDKDQWWDASLEGDARWVYGTPPEGNGNYGWMQHMLYHTNPKGKIGIVLANMALTTNDKSEVKIKEGIVEADLVECIVALPDKLFTSTPIEASVWIINKNKKRKNEILFIDASRMGVPLSRTLNTISNDVAKKIFSTYHNWVSKDGYKDIVNFCQSVGKNTIKNKSYNLFPSNYIDKGKSKKISQQDKIIKQIQDFIRKYDIIEKINIDLRPRLDSLIDVIKVVKNTSLELFKLSDFLIESKEVLGEGIEPEVLTLTENAGFVYQKERFSKRIATDNTSKYKIVKKTDIAYNQYLLWAGAIDQCSIVDIGITSPAYKVFNIIEGFDKNLIGQILKSKYMVQKYEGISFGTVKRRRRAPVELFLNLDVMLPPVEVQQDLEKSTDLIQSEIYQHKLITRELNNLLVKVYTEIT